MSEPRRFAPMKVVGPDDNPIEFMLRDIEQYVAREGWDAPIRMFWVDRHPIGLHIAETPLGLLGLVPPGVVLEHFLRKHMEVEPFPDEGTLYAIVIAYEAWASDGCEARLVSACSLHGDEASLVHLHDRSGAEPDEITYLPGHGDHPILEPAEGPSVRVALRALMAAIHDHPNGGPNVN